VITGTVRADSSGQPVSGVEVLLQTGGRKAVTNSSGRFVFESIQPGSYTALFRLVGFRPILQSVRVTGRDTVWVNPLLVAGAVELPPIETVAEENRPRGSGLEAFEERRKMGFGEFIDSKELRELEHLRLGEVLRRRTRVVLKGPRGGPANFSAGQPVYASGSRQVGPSGLPCWMQVIVDGQPLYRSGLDKVPPDLHNEFTTSEMEAIEVYYGAGGTPSEFNSAGAACGTIVLWTRRGLKP
jgi:hypothetical protein